MKYILIILIIISFAFGQVPDCNKGFFAETEPFYTRPITVCDIMQYAEECYNDSTYQHIDRMSAEGFVNDVVNYQWVHKTPTLKGLIEWLEKGKE